LKLQYRWRTSADGHDRVPKSLPEEACAVGVLSQIETHFSVLGLKADAEYRRR
jgi:hypothetical protein